MATTAASIAVRAVMALVWARSIVPRPMQSNATSASWIADSSWRVASCNAGSGVTASGVVIKLLS